MDQQQIIQVLFGVAGGCVVWWVNKIWAMVQSQQEQITAVNLKLAEHYVQKSDFEKSLDRIFDAVDEIKKEVTHISRNQASIKTLREMLGKEAQ